jgi:hypothetical protein
MRAATPCSGHYFPPLAGWPRRTVGQVKAAMAAMGGFAFGFAFMVAVVAERLMHQVSLAHVLGESPETITQMCEL